MGNLFTPATNVNVPTFGITYNDYDLIKGSKSVSFGRHVEPRGSNSKATRKNNLQIYTN